MAWDSTFEVAFHPKTIAIVGVSNNPRGNHVGFNGLTTFCNIREQGFEGRIYPINPKINEVRGVRAYPSVSAVPELVDLVIVAVPADIVPQVLEDCIVAGALNIHIMSSGFGETGQEEGRRLSETIRQIARRGIGSSYFFLGAAFSFGLGVALALSGLCLAQVLHMVYYLL